MDGRKGICCYKGPGICWKEIPCRNRKVRGCFPETGADTKITFYYLTDMRMDDIYGYLVDIVIEEKTKKTSTEH